MNTFIIKNLLLVSIFFFSTQLFAHEKVVVVPLNSKRVTPGSIIISGSSFHADTTETDYTYDPNGGKLSQDTSASQRFFAPVQLPHGATVTKLTLYCYDADAYIVQAALKRSSPSSFSTGETIFIASSTGTSGNQTREDSTSVAGREVVDNTTYSYMLMAYFSAGAKSLYGVRIDYE